MKDWIGRVLLTPIPASALVPDPYVTLVLVALLASWLSTVLPSPFLPRFK